MNPTVQSDYRDQGLAAEDWARADCYALISHLFSGRVQTSVLAGLASGESVSSADTSPVGFEYSELQRNAKRFDAARANEEYVDLFVGVGRPEVMLFASHYLSGFLNDKPLAELRQVLQELGIQKDESMTDTEDHFAFVCEVMRYLILADSPPKPLSEQRAFFQRWIAPVYERLCEAVEASPKADFYLAVSRFTRVFLDIETQSFDFESVV